MYFLCLELVLCFKVCAYYCSFKDFEKFENFWYKSFKCLPGNFKSVSSCMYVSLENSWLLGHRGHAKGIILFICIYFPILCCFAVHNVHDEFAFERRIISLYYLPQDYMVSACDTAIRMAHAWYIGFIKVEKCYQKIISSGLKFFNVFIYWEMCNLFWLEHLPAYQVSSGFYWRQFVWGPL